MGYKKYIRSTQEVRRMEIHTGQIYCLLLIQFDCFSQMLPLRSWHVSAIQGYVGSNCNLTRSSESWHVQNVCVYVKPTAVQLYQGPSFKLSNPHPRLSPGAMGPLSWLVSATPCKERHVLYDAFTHLQLHFVPPTNFFRRCFVIHEGTKECGVSDIIQWKNMEMLGSYLGTFWKLTKLWCLWNVAWYYINLVSPCHPTYPACMDHNYIEI